MSKMMVEFEIKRNANDEGLKQILLDEAKELGFIISNITVGRAVYLDSRAAFYINGTLQEKDLGEVKWKARFNTNGKLTDIGAYYGQRSNEIEEQRTNGL